MDSAEGESNDEEEHVADFVPSRHNLASPGAGKSMPQAGLLPECDQDRHERSGCDELQAHAGSSLEHYAYYIGI
jgi:hypothetical protein